MFSHYESRFSKTGETISFETLVATIRDNPKRAQILQLRQEPYGTERYKKIKNSMPVVTPHCTFRNNGSKSSNNIESFSRYFYFDVDLKDIKSDIETYTQHLLNTIGNVVCLLGKSIGGRGLFFYVKVADIEIQNSNFKSIRTYIKDKYFSDIPIDKKCSNKNRLQYIPYDENVYYQDNEIYFNETDIESLTHSQSNNTAITHCILRMGERYTPITDLCAKYNFETQVEVVSELYDVKPVYDYKKIFIPRIIGDGYKHKCFSTIANQVIRLNESITQLDLMSYMYYINKYHTDGKPMMHGKLENLVSNVFKETRENGLVLGKVKTKNVHFNKKAKPTRYEKIVIASRENGKIRRMKSINLIKDAIVSLRENGMKITQANVVRFLSGKLSRGPVERYWRMLIYSTN